MNIIDDIACRVKEVVFWRFLRGKHLFCNENEKHREHDFYYVRHAKQMKLELRTQYNFELVMSFLVPLGFAFYDNQDMLDLSYSEKAGITPFLSQAAAKARDARSVFLMLDRERLLFTFTFF